MHKKTCSVTHKKSLAQKEYAMLKFYHISSKSDLFQVICGLTKHKQPFLKDLNPRKSCAQTICCTTLLFESKIEKSKLKQIQLFPLHQSIVYHFRLQIYPNRAKIIKLHSFFSSQCEQFLAIFGFIFAKNNKIVELKHFN